MDVGIGRWWRVWLVVDHVAPLVAIYEGWWIHVGECEVVGACGLLWKMREREREREREAWRVASRTGDIAFFLPCAW